VSHDLPVLAARDAELADLEQHLLRAGESGAFQVSPALPAWAGPPS
jgi:hypothetical protein